MTTLDIILGVILAIALLKGIKNGLFIELASLISLILGIYVALKFSFLTKDVIGRFVHWNPNTIQVVAFVMTFMMIVVGISVLAKVLTQVMNFAFLGIINKIGGGFFRVLKTVLIISVVFSVFEKINYNNILVKKETLDNSVFYNPIQKTASYLFPSLKSWYRDLRKIESGQKTNSAQ